MRLPTSRDRLAAALAATLTATGVYLVYARRRELRDLLWPLWLLLPPLVEEEPQPEPGAPPECRPIHTVAGLLAWHPPDGEDDPCASRAPLDAALAAEERPGPQLLVCHDMQGGYLPGDRCPDGCADPCSYRIDAWHVVDLFVYFSHHFVTVPPVGWIEAAHRNGTKVLGTLITEGVLGLRRCGLLLSSREAAERAADKLVRLAAHCGFEGWLLNIEHPLPAQQVQVLLHFVSYLRGQLEATVPGGTLIWYDAVTATGALRHQNSLSPANQPFFNAAGKLFTNYWWTGDTPSQAAAAAGARAPDVFLGIDVFGRGTYGGGGHGCGAALAAARSVGCSAALFAPGWVWEHHPREQHEQLQEAWWSEVARAWGSSRPVRASLPLTTSFDCGAGLARFQQGAVLRLGGFCNLRQQQLLPCLEAAPAAGPVQTLTARLTTTTAWDGGSCLLLEERAAISTASAPVRLFYTRVPVPAGGLEVACTVACSPDCALALMLEFEAPSGSAAPSDGQAVGGSPQGSSGPTVALLPAVWAQWPRIRVALQGCWAVLPMQPSAARGGGWCGAPRGSSGGGSSWGRADSLAPASSLISGGVISYDSSPSSERESADSALHRADSGADAAAPGSSSRQPVFWVVPTDQLPSGARDGASTSSSSGASSPEAEAGHVVRSHSLSWHTLSARLQASQLPPASQLVGVSAAMLINPARSSGGGSGATAHQAFLGWLSLTAST